MTNAMITSVARQILLAGGGFIVGKGWVDAATYTEIVGAISIIIGSIWAMKTRTKAGLISSTENVLNPGEVVTSKK